MEGGGSSGDKMQLPQRYTSVLILMVQGLIEQVRLCVGGGDGGGQVMSVLCLVSAGRGENRRWNPKKNVRHLVRAT